MVLTLFWQLSSKRPCALDLPFIEPRYEWRVTLSSVELENVQYISPPRHPLVAISLAFARLIRRHPSNNIECNVPGLKTFPTRISGFSNLKFIGEISKRVYQPHENRASFHAPYSTIPSSTVPTAHSFGVQKLSSVDSWPVSKHTPAGISALHCSRLLGLSYLYQLQG